MKWLCVLACLMLSGCDPTAPTIVTPGTKYKHEIVWVKGVDKDGISTVKKFYTDEYVFRGPNCVEFIDKETAMRVRLVSTCMVVYSANSEAGE